MGYVCCLWCLLVFRYGVWYRDYYDREMIFATCRGGSEEKVMLSDARRILRVDGECVGI